MKFQSLIVIWYDRNQAPKWTHDGCSCGEVVENAGIVKDKDKISKAIAYKLSPQDFEDVYVERAVWRISKQKFNIFSKIFLVVFDLPYTATYVQESAPLMEEMHWFRSSGIFDRVKVLAKWRNVHCVTS